MDMEEDAEAAEYCAKVSSVIPLSEASALFSHGGICVGCPHKLECEQLASQLFAK
jgi:hypothetical protein